MKKNSHPRNLRWNGRRPTSAPNLHHHSRQTMQSLCRRMQALGKQYSDIPLPPSRPAGIPPPPPPAPPRWTRNQITSISPARWAAKGAFNGLHAGIGVEGLPSLMPPPTKTPVYSVLGSPFAKYISHIPSARLNTGERTGSPAPPFLLAARRETHNDPLRATWDTVTAGGGVWGRGVDNACIVSFL